MTKDITIKQILSCPDVPNIIYVDWGLANNFGSFIELHKDLKDYPDLHEKILKHELSHTNKTFSWTDFKLDFNLKEGLDFNLIKFILARPRTWIQFLPIYWQGGKGFVYDINCSIYWVLGLMVVAFDVALIKSLL